MRYGHRTTQPRHLILADAGHGRRRDIDTVRACLAVSRCQHELTQVVGVDISVKRALLPLVVLVDRAAVALNGCDAVGLLIYQRVVFNVDRVVDGLR